MAEMRRCPRCGHRTRADRMVKGFGRECATQLGLIGRTNDTGHDGPDLLDLLPDPPAVPTSVNSSGADEETAMSTVARALGVEAGSAEEVAGSVGNRTFAVRVVDGDDVIVKIGRPDLLTAERWACRRVRAAGVPAPEVIAHGPAFIIMRVLAGCATSHPEIWRQAGRAMRTVHNIHLPGYGALSVRQNETGGRHDTWRAAVLSTLAGVPELVAAGVLTHDRADDLHHTITSSALMNLDRPGVLLHRDLKPPHIFGDRAELTGIIDWGDAGVGDPLFDIARVSMAGPDLLTAFLDGYELRLTPELHDSMRMYRMLWNLEALIFELRAGGDWFDSYRRGLEMDRDSPS